ncbi:MAG: type II toxin-antitoxin system VapC family toxin [Candidatus Limnocylindrales bacterium]
MPLLVAESSSGAGRSVLSRDPDMVVWWGTRVECSAALARSERVGRVAPDHARDAFGDLQRLRRDWTEIDPTDAVRVVAERLVRTHPLRAADALQLAAAIVAAEGRPGTLPFVTLDDRLTSAADREGFPVVRFDRPPS